MRPPMAARIRAIHRKRKRVCRRPLRSQELRRTTPEEVRRNITASRTKQGIRAERDSVSLLPRSQGLRRHGFISHPPFNVDSPPSIPKTTSYRQEPLGLGDTDSGTERVRERWFGRWRISIGISWSAKLHVGQNPFENCASAPTSDENICREGNAAVIPSWLDGVPSVIQWEFRCKISTKGTATPSAPRVVIKVFPRFVALICGGPARSFNLGTG